MTDRTHPDSGFPIAYSHYATYAEYVEALHARIAELEAKLEAIGAGGVSGPLMGKPQEMPGWMQYDERNDVLTIHGKRYAAGMFGADGFLSPPGTWLRVCVGAEDCVTLSRASLAASAGSEPVAWVDERALAWLANSRSLSATITTKLEKGKSFERPMPLYTHPSPPEGMVGGWIGVEERLPPPFEEVVVYPRPDDYCCEAFCDTAGKWKWAEYEHNFGVHHRACHVEYWLMLPEVPAPPTTSAGSGKGE